MRKESAALGFLGLWFLFFSCASATAQSVSHDVTSSGGDHYSAGGIEVSVTIGETMTETDQGVWGKLHRGFHQLYQTRGIIFDTICEGTSLFGYTETGLYEDVFTLPGGIDSIRVLDLTVIPAIVVGSTVTDVLCFGGSDGAIVLNIEGGLAPFTYEWSNGSGADGLSGLAAGNYLVIVNDALGCQGLGNIAVSQPPALSIIGQVENVSCNGAADGSISLLVIGGVPDYQYDWPAGGDTPVLEGLDPGVYPVTVSDANGCETSGQFTVTEPQELFLSAQVTDAGCSGATDGSIALEVTGGIGPYEILWSTGASGSVIVDAGAGEYDVTVTDLNGCVENLVSIQVSESNAAPLMPGAIVGDTQICTRSETVFSVPPVPNADSYIWILPAGWSGSSSGPSITAVAGAAGTVSVSALNQCGVSEEQVLAVSTIAAQSVLSGTVIYQGNAVSSGWVYTYTEILQSTGYQKADSVPIVNGQYVFPALPLYPASFILQAVAGAGHPGAVPTFYATNGMSHQWDNPALNYSLFSICGESQVRDITLIVEQIALDEPGFATLKGQVRWNGDGKVEAEDPIPLIDVVVERGPPFGNAYAMDVTDDEGRYEFTNVPALPGPGFFYRIYVSIPGIPMSDTYMLVVSSTDTLIEDLDFIVDTIANLIYPVGDSSLIGVEDETVSMSDKLVLMPNPMSDQMTVRMPQGFNALTYRISDARGVLVREERLQAPDTVFTIKRGSLAAGMHILEVHAADGRRLAVRFLTR